MKLPDPDRTEYGGRTLCMWGMGAFRSILVGVAIVAVIGGFEFYTKLNVLVSTVTAMSSSLEDINDKLSIYNDRILKNELRVESLKERQNEIIRSERLEGHDTWR